MNGERKYKKRGNPFVIKYGHKYVFCYREMGDTTKTWAMYDKFLNKTNIF